MYYEEKICTRNGYSFKEWFKENPTTKKDRWLFELIVDKAIGSGCSFRQILARSGMLKTFAKLR